MKYTKKNYFLIIGLLVCCYIHVQAQDDYIYHNWGKLKYDTIYSVSYNTKNTEDRFHRDKYLIVNYALSIMHYQLSIVSTLCPILHRKQLRLSQYSFLS